MSVKPLTIDGMSTEFTEWLRSQSDDRLRALVSVRPELITPVPAHLEGLAGRAGSPSAVGRALDRLDRFTLAVMETLVVLPGPVPYRSLRTQMARALPGTAGQAFQSALKEAVERLRTMALVYGPDRALTPAPGVREVLDGPAGLGPPAEEAFRHHSAERLAELVQDAGGEDGDTREALAALLGDPEIVGRLVEEVSPQARSALNELAWGPASGRVPNARREVRAATAKSPIEQLLSRALLAATGEETVVLPREVALFLRDGRIHRDLSPSRPRPGAPSPTRGSPTARRPGRPSPSPARWRSCANAGASTRPACSVAAAWPCAISNGSRPCSTSPNGWRG